MKKPAKPAEDALLMNLVRAIVAGDADGVTKMLKESPALARQAIQAGATRQDPQNLFFDEIHHHLYAGDTPLHAAAAGHNLDIARELIKLGASVTAMNRRGAQPLHYAADGGRCWNSKAQADMITLLVSEGSDPNALDKSGVAPLHRAVRHRSLAAVDSLLRNGADIRLRNKSGSTPLHLAVQNTGASGSGSPESKAQQKEIILRLLKAGADPKARDGHGKTVLQCIQSEWIRELF